MLWIPVTIAAAVSQLLRNALQSSLTGAAGTMGATLVRFLYALPFAVVVYALVLLFGGVESPGYPPDMLLWASAGAVVQIGATALMLKAMHQRGFAIAYAYIKTEPILIALGGWWLLGDKLPLLAWIGVAVATTGVLWSALPSGGVKLEAGPLVLGITGGAMFGLSAICFRAALLALGEIRPWLAALHNMTCVLSIQTAVMLLWLWFADRKAIFATFRAWKPSLAAGLTGFFATLFWFTGFALTAAANVRTLALVEMPLAALINRRVSGKSLSPREWSGIALVAAGIGMLVVAVTES
jgi:drug/metabolite transporter (DMT)-like permease